VGYKASPVLWKTVKKGLSAGRVQTVALRLIVEREREIRAFRPVEYWTIHAMLDAGEPPIFEAKLSKYKGEDIEVNNQAAADAVVAAVNKSDAALSAKTAVGWEFNVDCYSNPNSILFTNTTPTYLWIDNLQVNRSKDVTPPPTLSSSIADATPALNLILNNQYDRTSLRLNQTTGVGWLGQPDTTYSFTISQFPNTATYPNNQAHIFVAYPNGASAIDYNSSNVIWLNVQGNTDGTATAFFRYKIFEPNSNANMFGADTTNGPLGSPWAGQLASLNASTPIGTWSMTFSQDTNVTLKGPGGVSTSFIMNPDVVAQFPDPLNVLFGAQPNNSPSAIGQAVVLTRASLTNSAGGVLVDDDFLADAGVLNTVIWTISAALGVDVQLYPPDPGQKLVKWTIPDTYFGLQVSSNVLGPWTALSGSGVSSPITTYSAGGLRTGLVPSVNLGPNQNYFRMFKKLAGMTGTAVTEAGEFLKIYKLDVIQVPTNLPMVRLDQEDTVYRTEKEKWKSITDEIARLHEKGQPVLVGTTSVEKSEKLSGMLQRRGVKHEVLNAKHHEREAHIVAKAGEAEPARCRARDTTDQLAERRLRPFEQSDYSARQGAMQDRSAGRHPAKHSIVFDTGVRRVSRSQM
jgi:hypothetical protein